MTAISVMHEGATIVSGKYIEPYVTHPIHAYLELQLKQAAHGLDNTVLFGPRGVGKSYVMQRLVERWNADEAEQELSVPGHTARYVLYYQSSKAAGTKTALIDFYERLTEGELSPGLKKQWSPTQLQAQIVAELEARRVHAVCIDEAGRINVQNLDLLCSVADEAAARGHPFGVILVGNNFGDYDIVASLTEMKQLGQRFGTSILMPKLTASEIAECLLQLHPAMASLRVAVGPKDWKHLLARVTTSAAGSIRRLVRIVGKAHTFAAEKQAPLTAEDVVLGCDTLAPED